MEFQQPISVFLGFIIGLTLMFFAKMLIKAIFCSIKMAVALSILVIAMNIGMPKQSVLYNEALTQHLNNGVIKAKTMVHAIEDQVRQYTFSFKINKKDLNLNELIKKTS